MGISHLTSQEKTKLLNRTPQHGQGGKGQTERSMNVDHQSHKGPWENDDKAERTQMDKVKSARLSHM